MAKTNFAGIKPVNKEQEDLFDELNKMAKGTTSCLAVTGKAGTGKSLIIGAYILDQITKNPNTKVVFSKPMEIVGGSKYFGTVPGDVQEKFSPFLLNYKYLFEKLNGKNGAMMFDMFITQGVVSFTPIELMRGVSFPKDTIVYLDECQNIDEHMILTLGTRVEEGCQLIISGDLNQIDILRAKFKSGLATLVENEKYQKSKITGHVHLVKVERGPIAELFAEIFESE